jgi:hypothetical protein
MSGNLQGERVKPQQTLRIQAVAAPPNINDTKLQTETEPTEN